MFGLGKTQAKSEAQAQTVAPEVQTIPDLFYGGQDPVIYHTPEQKGETLPTQKIPEKKPEKKKEEKLPPATGRGVPAPLSKRKKYFIIGGIVFVLGLLTWVVSWYYIRQAREALYGDTASRKPQASVSVVSPAPQAAPVAPAPPLPPPATSTPSTSAPSVEEELEEEDQEQILADLSFPKTFLLDSADLDADQLTDEEEEFFGTDPAVWDTDKDSYFDGQEVVNLYNPSGFAPVKLIDAGLIAEYVNPFVPYRLYYPNTWALAAVDKNAMQVLVSAVTGEYIEIRTMKKTQDVPFALWFAAHAEGEEFQDLVSAANRFQVPGWKRKDGLVAYYDVDSVVYVIIYHQGTGDRVLYRHVMEMFIQSFRPPETAPFLPEQPILPTPPDAEPTPIDVDTDEESGTSTEASL